MFVAGWLVAVVIRSLVTIIRITNRLLVFVGLDLSVVYCQVEILVLVKGSRKCWSEKV
jgi:hypothetical protein